MPPPIPASPRPADAESGRSAALPLVPGIERPRARTRPLPDAEAIRLLTVPDSAPPYDGDAGAAERCGRAAADPRPGPAGQPRGPDGPCRESQRRQLPGPDGPGPQRGQPPGGTGPGPQRTVPDGADAARRADPAAGWPERFAQVLTETLAGSRSQGQIEPWTSVQARRRIRQLGPVLTAGAAPRIRRVVTMRPAADVMEMTVVVGFGDRVRALAVRLERERQRDHDPIGTRWVCTAIEAA